MDRDTRFLAVAAEALSTAAAELKHDNDEAEFKRFVAFQRTGRPASYFQNQLWAMWGGKDRYLALLTRHYEAIGAASIDMGPDERRHAEKYGDGCRSSWSGD